MSLSHEDVIISSDVWLHYCDTRDSTTIVKGDATIAENIIVKECTGKWRGCYWQTMGGASTFARSLASNFPINQISIKVQHLL